jgi:hypothetical protein
MGHVVELELRVPYSAPTVPCELVVIGVPGAKVNPGPAEKVAAAGPTFTYWATTKLFGAVLKGLTEIWPTKLPDPAEDDIVVEAPAMS